MRLIGDANLEIGGDTSIDTIKVGNDFILNGGGDFTFDTLDAGGVQVDVDGGVTGSDIIESEGDLLIKAGSLDVDSLTANRKAQISILGVIPLLTPSMLGMTSSSMEAEISPSILSMPAVFRWM